MSLLASQMLYSNSITNKAKEAKQEAKVVTTQLMQKMYPNPATKGNIINITLQLTQTSLVNLIVLDMIGNKVIDTKEEYKAGKQNFHFHTDKLTEGVYFVNIISDENKHVQRLIIR